MSKFQARMNVSTPACNNDSVNNDKLDLDRLREIACVKDVPHCLPDNWQIVETSFVSDKFRYLKALGPRGIVIEVKNNDLGGFQPERKK